MQRKGQESASSIDPIGRVGLIGLILPSGACASAAFEFARLEKAD